MAYFGPALPSRLQQISKLGDGKQHFDDILHGRAKLPGLSSGFLETAPGEIAMPFPIQKAIAISPGVVCHPAETVPFFSDQSMRDTKVGICNLG